MSVTDISAAVAAAGALAGITYYAIQMRNQTKLKRMEALIQLFSLTSTEKLQEPFWLISTIKAKNYEEYAKEYGGLGSENPDPHARNVNMAVWKVLGVYDLIGTMLYKKLIDIDLVHLSLTVSTTKKIYEILSPIIIGIRKGINEPVLGGFDYLVNELSRNELKLRMDAEKMMRSSKMTASKG